VTACAWCPNEAVLTPYFDDTLKLCGPCAQGLAQRLDDEDLWPPLDAEGETEEGDVVLVVAAVEEPLQYDGRELRRMAGMLCEYGARLHVEKVAGRPALWFTEPVPPEAARMAGRHCWLLIYAWASQASRAIKACDHCSAPFLTIPSNISKCPVCAKGKRTETIKIPFTPPPALPRRRSA
jgi:hypothetical protein